MILSSSLPGCTDLSVLYYRVPRLFAALSLARGDGRYSRTPPKTSRFEGFRGVMASAVGEVLRCAVSPVFSTWMSV